MVPVWWHGSSVMAWFQYIGMLLSLISCSPCFNLIIPIQKFWISQIHLHEWCTTSKVVLDRFIRCMQILKICCRGFQNTLEHEIDVTRDQISSKSLIVFSYISFFYKSFKLKTNAIQWTNYFSAAWQIVPHVSAMSSTKMATLFLASPTRTIDATSLAFFRSLWMRAKSTFSLSAIEVTLKTEDRSVDRD